ncbi:hypothetical protein ACHAO8_003256 [Botrytis cinerea]
MSTRGNRARSNSLMTAARSNQAGESRMNDLTMWRGYSGAWSTKKEEVKDYLDWNGFEALEIRPVNAIVILGCRIDTEILLELYVIPRAIFQYCSRGILDQNSGGMVKRELQCLRRWYLTRDHESSQDSTNLHDVATGYSGNPRG